MPNLGNLAGAAQKPLQYNRSQTQEGTLSSLPSAPLHLSPLPPHTATISNACKAVAVAGAGF